VLQMGNMTPEQAIFFRDNGYLLLKGALPRKQLDPIKNHVLAELKRLKIWSSGRTLSASMKKTPVFQQVTKQIQLIRYPALYSRVITPEIQSAITSLAQRRLGFDQDAQFLISLPHGIDWTLHGLKWHVDISLDTPGLPGIQAFILIDDVRLRGGATMAVVGSHALADRGKRGRAREILKGSGDIEKELADLGLSILEMSGEAGDVYLMDMRLLHTPSVNATQNVRLMATARFFTV